MSFISDRVHQFNESQKKYTPQWLEDIWVERLTDQIKSAIENAISNKKSQVKKYCITEYDHFCPLYEVDLNKRIDEHLKQCDGYSSVNSLADVFSQDKGVEIAAAREIEEKVNLVNIENRIQRHVFALGAKSAEVHIKPYEHFVDTWEMKDSFWRGAHSVKKKVKFRKYKVCYYVSW